MQNFISERHHDDDHMHSDETKNEKTVFVDPVCGMSTDNKDTFIPYE